ncbi:hypothetical protein AZE42_04741 [Rhizopogon vesiculosus]|uniref:Uncharacterized protein n=1 Tax=Rhizopogon vesiculosus TaxID=180088 RepID=A0A1J8PW77_9AGAM|nr:hypothetical protein AZE42_04741 [Rhizopogon vesiculosus]
MTTNALVFKSTIHPARPLVYYIPIQNNYSDLYDVIVFFCGDLAGRGAQDELAAQIAREARELSSTFYREDMVTYSFGCVRALFLSWLWRDVVTVSIPIQSFWGGGQD